MFPVCDITGQCVLAPTQKYRKDMTFLVERDLPSAELFNNLLTIWCVFMFL